MCVCVRVCVWGVCVCGGVCVGVCVALLTSSDIRFSSVSSAMKRHQLSWNVTLQRPQPLLRCLFCLR